MATKSQEKCIYMLRKFSLTITVLKAEMKSNFALKKGMKFEKPYNDNTEFKSGTENHWAMKPN
jgi:hypothetical protein